MATDALAAMQPDMRALVQSIKDAPYRDRHMLFARACHTHTWPRSWADHVYQIIIDDDDDIPF